MSRPAKNWVGCDMPGCEEEVLANWAVRTGWKLGERADWCPVHGGRTPYSGWDVKERAAADDTDEPDALDEVAGSRTGTYPPGYLDDLREGWPE